MSKIAKGMGQIHDHLHGRPATRLTMVAPPVPRDAHGIRKSKAHKFDKYLEELSKKEGFEFAYLQARDMPVHMDGIHPTIEGTKQPSKASMRKSQFC